MTTETPPKSQLLRLVLLVLVAFSGMCAIFASVVTAAQAWQEHAQERWPRVTALVERCGLDQTSSGRREKYYIHCRLSYAVGTEQNAANVYSSNVPSPKVWQYPPNQIGPLEQWVGEHPPGTPIVLRYDPAHHAEVVLVGADMPPLAGPRTPRNVKLLEVGAGSFLVLLMIARSTRPDVRRSWRSRPPYKRRPFRYDPVRE